MREENPSLHLLCYEKGIEGDEATGIAEDAMPVTFVCTVNITLDKCIEVRYNYIKVRYIEVKVMEELSWKIN